MELNGVANIHIIMSSFAETKEDGTISLSKEDYANLMSNLDLLERYMLAYSNAAKQNETLPFWHEIRQNKEKYPTVAEKFKNK